MQAMKMMLRRWRKELMQTNEKNLKFKFVVKQYSTLMLTNECSLHWIKW